MSLGKMIEDALMGLSHVVAGICAKNTLEITSVAQAARCGWSEVRLDFGRGGSSSQYLQGSFSCGA